MITQHLPQHHHLLYPTEIAVSGKIDKTSCPHDNAIINKNDSIGIDNDSTIGTNPTSKKRVTFNSRVRVRPALHRKDMTTKEIRQCWYNREEITAVKQENARTIVAAKGLGKGTNQNTKDKEQSDLGDQQLCMRGLEGRTKEGSRKRRTNKKNGLTTVLHVQHENSNNQDKDEAIRGAFITINRRSRIEAYGTALADQVTALQIHFETEPNPARRRTIQVVIRNTMKVRRRVLKDKEKRQQ